MIFLSGDDAEAKSEVAALFDDAGFVAIDLGGLVAGSAMQQFGGPLAGVNLIQLPEATSRSARASRSASARRSPATPSTAAARGGSPSSIP